MKRGTFLGTLALLAGVALGGLLAVWVVLWLSLQTSAVKVPAVEGQPPEMAARTLQQVGLVPRVQEPVPDPRHPIGVVARQKPVAGFQVKRGATVFLYPSAGAATVRVPDLRGLPEPLAVAELEQLGLGEGSRAEVLGRGAAVGVLAQVPPPGSMVAPGTQVSLLVNRGAEEARVVMPDLVGQSLGLVEGWLAAWGFRLDGVEQVPYPGLSPGTVVKQTPAAGGPAPLRGGVVLWVSR